MYMSDDDFNRLITRAMDELPQKYIKGLENVAVVMADEPTDEQATKIKLGEDKLLLGLYEGIPLTKRGNNYSFVLPDKITLFKNHLVLASENDNELFENIKRTLWHEIAHYYGLNHKRIHELENGSS